MIIRPYLWLRRNTVSLAAQGPSFRSIGWSISQFIRYIFMSLYGLVPAQCLWLVRHSVSLAALFPFIGLKNILFQSDDWSINQSVGQVVCQLASLLAGYLRFQLEADSLWVKQSVSHRNTLYMVYQSACQSARREPRSGSLHTC